MLEHDIKALAGNAKNILLAGCGGGYDIFGAVPFVRALDEPGRGVHLASLSFTYLNGLAGAVQNNACPNLYEVSGEAATERAYCPEAWLSKWLEQQSGRRVPIWCFDKTGVRPLLAAYEHLVARLQIDCIVLIDGGIDSLLRGDEVSLGTPAEDLVSLAAVHQVQGPTKILTCVGLSAEMRDGISHAQVFERIAALGQSGGLLAQSMLLRHTEAGARYRAAVEFAFAHQREQRQSHIHRVISAALEGEFGAQGPDIWLSPLLPMYWFFSLARVVENHFFLNELLNTQSIGEVTLLIEGLRKSLQVRGRELLPI